MTKQTRNIRFTVAALCVLIGIIVAGFVNRMLQPSYMTNDQLQLNGAYVLPSPRIIKPFDLIDQNGQAFTLDNLKDKWTMVFFGFTNCPDVCPATLSLMRQFKELMGADNTADNLQIVLVSVDPVRDTPDVLKTYLTYFDDEFIGVTGEFLSLQAFATNLSAAFYKVPGGGQNYQIDHSANVVLVNPYGHYHAFYKPQLEPAKMKITYRSIHSQLK